MPKGKATKVLRLANMVTDDDLKEDDEYDEFVEDIREEAAKFGSVTSCKIPRSTVASGFGYVCGCSPGWCRV
jgi:splicing factor U2AF subunit